MFTPGINVGLQIYLTPPPSMETNSKTESPVGASSALNYVHEKGRNTQH